VSPKSKKIAAITARQMGQFVHNRNVSWLGFHHAKEKAGVFMSRNSSLPPWMRFGGT
jgi:hypothetical protein